MWLWLMHDKSGPVWLWVPAVYCGGKDCGKGRFWACSERMWEWWMLRVMTTSEMTWQTHEEVSRDWWGWQNEFGSWFQSRRMFVKKTSNPAVTERLRDASCLSVLSFNIRVQSFIISYFCFRFTDRYNFVMFSLTYRRVLKTTSTLLS